MVTDRVGDFIIRLQNAARIGKREVIMPLSNHVLAIARKLKELGFISEVTTEQKGQGATRVLIATLAYDAQGRPKLRGVKRVSSPGRRLYVSSAEAHTVKGGTGARLLSTPAGIISDREARTLNVGGEDLFEIW
jgi:small subunit ribosomal protein S8